MARLTTEERQKIIIDEAINIIHEGGYGSLSIRELASKVKISEPAIYRHFLNKEDIVMGILARIGEFDITLQSDLSNSSSVDNKLLRFIMFHFDFLNNNKEMTSVLFAEEIFNQSDILKNKLMNIIEHRKSLLNAIIEQGITEGHIKDIGSSEIATMILGFIRLTVLEWRLSMFRFDLRERGNSVVEAIYQMIRK